MTSGRPTRSMRTLNLPRVSVSATTPTSARAPSVGAVDLDDEPEDVLAVEIDRPGSLKARSPVATVFSAAGASQDERIPARAGEDAHAVPGTAAFVVDPKRDGLAGRSGARAFLLERLQRPWARRTRCRTRTPPCRGERCRLARPGGGEGRSRKPVEKPIGERVGELGERQRVHHEHEMAGPLRARERVDVGDVGDRVRQCTRAGDVIGHARQSAASSSSGCSAGCWSASAASGWSSTRWKAAFTRWALRISFTVPP